MRISKKEKSFHHLPPEIREHIFSFCKVVDLKNLACCNTHYCTQVTYWLFSRLNIDWSDLAVPPSSLKTNFSHLKFTKFIRIHSNEYNIFSPWHKISKNCIKLLNSCNNLKKLEINYADGTALKRILRTSKNLEHLDLRYSSYLHISCWKETSNLSSLRTLSFKYCEISDEALSIISKISKIQELTLDSCDGFTSKGLACVGDMVQLKKLTLYEDYDFKINGIPWITKMKNLIQLKCADFSLDSDILNICTSLIKLDTLTINDSKLKDRYLSSLYKLTSLKKLDLSYNEHINGLALKYVSSLKALTELDLKYCENLTDIGVQYLNSLTSLSVLNLDGCGQLTNLFLKSLELTSLKELYISGCSNITDEGLFYIKAFVHLEKLHMLQIQISDAGLVHIPVLKLNELLITYDINLLSRHGMVQFGMLAVMEPTLLNGYSRALRFTNKFDRSCIKTHDIWRKIVIKDDILSDDELYDVYKGQNVLFTNHDISTRLDKAINDGPI